MYTKRRTSATRNQSIQPRGGGGKEEGVGGFGGNGFIVVDKSSPNPVRFFYALSRSVHKHQHCERAALWLILGDFCVCVCVEVVVFILGNRLLFKVSVCVLMLMWFLNLIFLRKRSVVKVYWEEPQSGVVKFIKCFSKQHNWKMTSKIPYKWWYLELQKMLNATHWKICFFNIIILPLAE